MSIHRGQQQLLRWCHGNKVMKELICAWGHISYGIPDPRRSIHKRGRKILRQNLYTLNNEPCMVLEVQTQGFIQDSFLGREHLCAGKLISCGHRPQAPRGVWGHAPPEKFWNFKPSQSDFYALWEWFEAFYRLGHLGGGGKLKLGWGNPPFPRVLYETLRHPKGGTV